MPCGGDAFEERVDVAGCSDIRTRSPPVPAAVGGVQPGCMPAMTSSVSNASLLPPGSFDLDVRPVRVGHVQAEQPIEVERPLPCPAVDDLDDGRLHSNVHDRHVRRAPDSRRERIGQPRVWR